MPAWWPVMRDPQAGTLTLVAPQFLGKESEAKCSQAPGLEVRGLPSWRLTLCPLLPARCTSESSHRTSCA